MTITALTGARIAPDQNRCRIQRHFDNPVGTKIVAEPSDKYIVKPVYKALKVLRCLGEEGRELSLSEVSSLTGLPKSTTFKYLYTLREAGFINYREDADRYGLGTRLWELGRLAAPELGVRQLSLPVMQELRDSLNETINLGAIYGKEIVYLEMVESRHALRLLARVGGRDPIYSTALGKAILSHLPEEEWNAHLPSRLVPRTENTCTSLKALKHELSLTRKRGFAVERGENEPDAMCIGAPIFDHRGQALAAISVAGPISRLSGPQETEVARAVIEAADTISERLGYSLRDGSGREANETMSAWR
jgi:IclR family acetate operon transcriptional repressor